MERCNVCRHDIGHPFQRTLQLPYRVDPNQVQAHFQNGILTIAIPKSQAQQRSNRIEVRGVDEAQGIDKAQAGGNGKEQKSQQGQAEART